MTDENNTPKHDDDAPPEPVPAEAAPAAAGEAPPPAPVTLTPPEPAEGGPATGAAPETPPVEELAPEEPASLPPPTEPEPAPVAADATHAEVAAEEPDAEAGPESPLVAAEAEAAPAEADTATAVAEPAADSKKKWYAVKVQSGREESIKAAIERKVKIENLEPYFGQIVIPVEEVNEKKKVKVKVKDKKTGEVETTTQERNVVKKHKKFPGYIFAEVEFNDEILYVFRETSGVGDFVGIPARRGQGGERLAPAPMTEAEVQSMLTGVPVPGAKKGPGKTVVKLDYEKGDKVRIKNGAFAGHEAEVKAITEAKDPTDSPKVTVVVTMWGRGVDVTLDHWEVDKA